MAKRRALKMRGRAKVALALLGFLVVATGVIWRRSYGHTQRQELAELQRRRSQLESKKVQLEGEIRAASSRGRLQPIAEQRLNMHVPADTQVIILSRPTGRPDAP